MWRTRVWNSFGLRRSEQKYVPARINLAGHNLRDRRIDFRQRPRLQIRKFREVGNGFRSRGRAGTWRISDPGLRYGVANMREIALREYVIRAKDILRAGSHYEDTQRSAAAFVPTNVAGISAGGPQLTAPFCASWFVVAAIVTFANPLAVAFACYTAVTLTVVGTEPPLPFDFVGTPRRHVHAPARDETCRLAAARTSIHLPGHVLVRLSRHVRHELLRGENAHGRRARRYRDNDLLRTTDISAVPGTAAASGEQSYQRKTGENRWCPDHCLPRLGLVYTAWLVQQKGLSI